jgi:BASS family bile acid:Na+ symporter
VATAQLVHLLFPLSLALVVVALGMQARFSDVFSLLRRPVLLLKSLLAMNVLMVAVAAVIGTAFNLPAPVKLALVALALSPVPPFLPGKQLKLAPGDDYVFGLLISTVLLSVILIPLLVTLLQALHGGSTPVDPWAILRVVATSVLAPLAAGMLVRRVWPAFASRAHRMVAAAGQVLLGILFVLVLATGWRALAALIGGGTLLAFLAFAGIGLVLGHALGGPRPGDRSALALATASRHPGVAIAVCGALYPDIKAAPVAVLLYLIAGSLVQVPYTVWQRRRAPVAAAGSPSGTWRS